MNTVYKLIDPRNGRPRYVGITACSLGIRLRDHMRRATYGEDTHKDRWIRVLLAIGMEPRIAELERTDDRGREVFWIAKLKAEGCELTNTTDGGDGCSGWTEEMRRRASESRRGKHLSLAHAEAISRPLRAGYSPKKLANYFPKL